MTQEPSDKRKIWGTLKDGVVVVGEDKKQQNSYHVSLSPDHVEEMKDMIGRKKQPCVGHKEMPVEIIVDVESIRAAEDRSS